MYLYVPLIFLLRLCKAFYVADAFKNKLIQLKTYIFNLWKMFLSLIVDFISKYIVFYMK